MGLLERWDRRNQRVLERANRLERGRDSPREFDASGVGELGVLSLEGGFVGVVLALVLGLGVAVLALLRKRRRAA